MSLVFVLLRLLNLQCGPFFTMLFLDPLQPRQSFFIIMLMSYSTVYSVVQSFLQYTSILNSTFYKCWPQNRGLISFTIYIDVQFYSLRCNCVRRKKNPAYWCCLLSLKRVTCVVSVGWTGALGWGEQGRVGLVGMRQLILSMGLELMGVCILAQSVTTPSKRFYIISHICWKLLSLLYKCFLCYWYIFLLCRLKINHMTKLWHMRLSWAQ
jgi:hypothetical protein